MIVGAASVCAANASNASEEVSGAMMDSIEKTSNLKVASMIIF